MADDRMFRAMGWIGGKLMRKCESEIVRERLESVR